MNRESSQGGLNYVRHRGSHGTRRVGRGQGVARQKEAGEGDRARRHERRDLVKGGGVVRHVPRRVRASPRPKELELNSGNKYETRYGGTITAYFPSQPARHVQRRRRR